MSHPPKFFDVECADRAYDLKKLRTILKTTVGTSAAHHRLFNDMVLRIDEHPVARFDHQLANKLLRKWVIKIYLLDKDGNRVEDDVLDDSPVDPATVTMSIIRVPDAVVPVPESARPFQRIHKPTVRRPGEPSLRERVEARKATTSTTRR